MKLNCFFTLALGCIAILLVCDVAPVRAASFDFGITFDGIDPAVNLGSTDPIGVNLVPGDSFTLDFHASSGNFWRVDTPYTQSFPLSFIVNPSGDRLGDIVASFLLNGTEVENITELSTIQSEVHIGAQSWTLPVALEFDTIVMTYDLLSATEVDGAVAVDTTIRDRPDIFGSISNPERPFFRNSNISFNAIPEPATIGLLLVGFLAMGNTRRR